MNRGEGLGGRKLTVGAYLDRWLRGREEAEGDLKASTLSSYREALDLYFKPGLGHLRLIDLRDDDVRDLYSAMRKINQPEAETDKSDLLRRLLEARAKRAGKRYSARPLTTARIKRMHAVLSKALNDAVASGKISRNPVVVIKFGKASK
ncbi:hypothetical protein [Nonomuraea sp. 10N515B]|uniref:hypothetical protein n=1 Tax=Nonomuraea sp. 10N515B TaxID=3457422 RepID=UPI003FCE2F0E